MNLAQLIAPDWAQDGCKPRHALQRPEWVLPPLGLVRRDSNERKNSEVVEFIRRPRIVEEAAAPAKIAPALAPKPAKKRIGRGGKSFTPDDPWPRGKGGARYKILKAFGVHRLERLRLAKVAKAIGARLGEHAQIYQMVRVLTFQQLIEREGTPKRYSWRITAAGLKALDA